MYKKMTFKNVFKDDRKIATSVFSPIIILSVQYLLLYSFNVTDTYIGSVIKLISKIVVGILMLRAFSIVIKKKLRAIIILYCFMISIFLFHYVFFLQNRKYIIDIVFNFFSISLPLYIYALSITELKEFFKVAEKAAIFVLCVTSLTFILELFNIIDIGLYSMSLSYYLLFPCLLYLYKFMDTITIKSMFIVLISIVMILAIGARGPILCIACYLIIFLINQIREKNEIKKEIFYIIIILILLFGMIFLKEILTLLNNFLNSHGISSRSITLFLRDDVFLSGREDIYKEAFELIKKYPIFGVGIAGDRAFISGYYVHNLFLELLLDFGVFTGSIISIILIALFIKNVFFINNDKRKIYNIFFCMGVIPLMVSGSYLSDMYLYIYLGLIFNSNIKLSKSHNLL